MSAAEAVAAAASEHLTLVRANNASGFLNVVEVRGGRYQARIARNGELHQIGNFGSPEEVALGVARWRRDHGVEQSVHRGSVQSGHGANALSWREDIRQRNAQQFAQFQAEQAAEAAKKKAKRCGL